MLSTKTMLAKLILSYVRGRGQDLPHYGVLAAISQLSIFYERHVCLRHLLKDFHPEEDGGAAEKRGGFGVSPKVPLYALHSTRRLHNV